MPDIFFRTFICGAAVVALGAGAFIAIGKDASLEKEASAMRSANPSPASEAGYGTLRTQAVAMSGDSDTGAPVAAPAYMQHASGAVRGSVQGTHALPQTAVPAAVVREPVISYGRDAVELMVPVNPQNGQSAYVPIALALAADPSGLPEPLQEAAREMAKDFLDTMADAAAVATGAQSADYFSRWQAAADWSDREFKMRYGRVAYVQMNQLLAQEAAAGIR